MLFRCFVRERRLVGGCMRASTGSRLLFVSRVGRLFQVFVRHIIRDYEGLVESVLSIGIAYWYV